MKYIIILIALLVLSLHMSASIEEVLEDCIRLIDEEIVPINEIWESVGNLPDDIGEEFLLHKALEESRRVEALDRRLELDFIEALKKSKNTELILIYCRKFLILQIATLEVPEDPNAKKFLENSGIDYHEMVANTKSRIEGFKSLLKRINEYIEPVAGTDGVR